MLACGDGTGITVGIWPGSACYSASWIFLMAAIFDEQSAHASLPCAIRSMAAATGWTDFDNGPVSLGHCWHSRSAGGSLTGIGFTTGTSTT